MKVLGIDFTSNPSALHSKARQAKWMKLASCTLEDDILSVDEITPLNGPRRGDFSEFEATLASDGPWIAGIDVPFGMPVACIEYFGWLKPDDISQDWEGYVERCGAIEDRRAFKTLIESWRHPIKKNKRGEQQRVRRYRLTDTTAGAQSPMNCIRPGVGQMFYEAAKRIRQSPASVPPVRIREDETRVVVEAYPRLVADRLIGNKNYKDAVGLEDIREQIVREMQRMDPDAPIVQHYGLHVVLSTRTQQQCVEDRGGDVIDSVLSAIQAAWSHGQRNSGIPDCSCSVTRGLLALEGWIVDPFLWNFMRREGG